MRQLRRGQLDFEGPAVLKIRTLFGEALEIAAPVVGQDFFAGVRVDSKHFVIVANSAIAEARLVAATANHSPISKTADELCEFIDRFSGQGTRIRLSFLAPNQSPISGWFIGRNFGLIELSLEARGQVLFPLVTVSWFEFFCL